MQISVLLKGKLPSRHPDVFWVRLLTFCAFVALIRLNVKRTRES